MLVRQVTLTINPAGVSDLNRDAILRGNLSAGIEEKGIAQGMAQGMAAGEDKLASLLRKLIPGSEDYKNAISDDIEVRAAVFKKYGMEND